MNIIGGMCMSKNIEIVKKLFSEEPAIKDMRDYTNMKLKVWENEVTSYFPVKS